MAAKMSQLFLLDLLYLEYFKQTSAQSVERKAKTTAAISEKQL
jgi:DNA-binding MurR/RpiR family transcriptional regulator